MASNASKRSLSKRSDLDSMEGSGQNPLSQSQEILNQDISIIERRRLQKKKPNITIHKSTTLKRGKKTAMSTTQMVDTLALPSISKRMQSVVNNYADEFPEADGNVRQGQGASPRRVSSFTHQRVDMLIPQQAPKMNELNMDQSGSGQSDNSQRRHDS